MYVKTYLYWILVAVLIVAIFGVSDQSAHAGVVPPSAIKAYPGLDPRLVGVPIVKTDTSAALVAYSEAVAHVDALNAEKGALDTQVLVLEPELIRAQDLATTQTLQLNQVSAALTTIILAQYQDISSSQDQSTLTPSQLRIGHQSSRVSEMLRASKKKSQERKDTADNYVKSVDASLATSKKRIEAIGTELVIAQQKAKDQRNIVRSGIPLALIEGLEIPVLTMDAYLRAEKKLAETKPECGLTWWALAGIGRAESNHGLIFGSLLDQTGTVSPPIIGVALNGNGFAAIADSDDGVLDGDLEWDRAVGVMQFIPGTWKGYAEDGNGDKVIDPQNVYDAAMAAANLLCANARPSMATEEGRRTAFFRYNNSKAYVDFVATRGHEYEVIGAGRFNPAPADPTAVAQ